MRWCAFLGAALVLLSASAATDVALSASPAVAIEFDAGVWTDVSTDARQATWDRGRSSDLDPFTAGKGSATLDNRLRTYDPEYSAGAYYGKLLPRKRIRIGFTYSGTTYWKFYGLIDGWPQAYDGPNDSTVTVTATDAFKVLAGARVPSPWAQFVPTMSPLSWWRLGESSGTTMIDSSGNGHHGEYLGGDVFNSRSGLVDRDSNSAIEFGESLGAIVDLTSNPTAAITAFPFSVAFWMEAAASPASPLAAGDIIWAQLSDAGGTTDGGRMLIQHAGSAGSAIGATDDGLLIIFTDASGNERKYTTDDAVADGTTHFVVVEVQDADSFAIFVDGESAPYSIYGTTGTSPDVGGPNGVQIVGKGLSLSATLDEMLVFDSLIDSTEAAQLYAAGHEPWVDDTPKERIDRVLDYLGWPSGDRDLDTGSAQLAAASLEGNALSHLQEVEVTEGGRLFVDRTGRVTLVGRQNAWSEAVYRSSNATFGDSGVELKYTARVGDLFGFDDEKIINEAVLTQEGGNEQTSVDTTSQGVYGVITHSEVSLETRPTVVKDRADYLISRYKDPTLRMPTVAIKPERSAAALYPVLGVNDLGYRYTFNRRPQNVGSVISKEFHVEAESAVITPDDITFEWELSPAEPSMWVWDTSTWETGASVARWGY